MSRVVSAWARFSQRQATSLFLYNAAGPLMSLLFTLCWLPTMTVAHQIHYKSGHTFVFLPTPAFSVHALLSTADPHTQWMAAKLLVLIVKKSNWLKKGWPEVRNADLVSVHLLTIRTKYYACWGWPALVTLCYDNPSSSRPGVDTAELGRDGGSRVMDRFIVPRLKIP